MKTKKLPEKKTCRAVFKPGTVFRHGFQLRAATVFADFDKIVKKYPARFSGTVFNSIKSRCPENKTL